MSTACLGAWSGGRGLGSPLLDICRKLLQNRREWGLVYDLRAMLIVSTILLSFGAACGRPWQEGDSRDLCGPQKASRPSLDAEKEGVTFIAGFYHLVGKVLQDHDDTYAIGPLEEYDDAHKRFAALTGTWRILVGAVVAVLLLAGIALGAAAVRTRWMSRRGSGQVSCSGEPALDRCRTCKFMQSCGDGSFCTKLGIDLPSDGEDGDRKKGEG